MADITSLLNSNSSSAAAAAKDKTQSEEDFDSLIGTREDFLTILIAQLKQQYQLEPMKGTEFIDSITRLSSVEQSINQNTHLEKIEALLTAERNNFGTPVSYLDKQIDFTTSVISLKDGTSQFSYVLEERPDIVAIVIRDIDGDVIRTADGATDTGKNIINWDGKDSSGNDLSDGEYFVTVDYAMEDGEEAEYISTPVATKGIVTGANFENGDVILLVGNIRTTVGDIISITSLTQQANIVDDEESGS